MPHSIVIVRLSALGDVTMMLPMIHSLRAALPDAELTWIISRPAYDLLEGLEGIEFLVIDKPDSVRDYLALRRQLSGRRFDVLLAMQASLRVNLIYPFISSPRKIGYDPHRARDAQGIFINERIPFKPQHLVESFFAFIEHLGIHDRTMKWDLPLTHADRSWAKIHCATDKKILIVNPVASKSERTWLTERYIDVLRQAQQRWQLRIIITGGSSDQEIIAAREIEQALSHDVVNLQGATSPKQLAAVIECADCVLAPDTGPVHIATAVGTPVVGLYAVAPPELSGPYHDRHRVVNRYLEAMRMYMGNDVATVPWGTRVHHPDAMACIEVDDVMQSIATVFDESAS